MLEYPARISDLAVWRDDDPLGISFCSAVGSHSFARRVRSSNTSIASRVKLIDVRREALVEYRWTIIPTPLEAFLIVHFQ